MKLSDLYKHLRGDILYHYTHFENLENLKKHKVIYSTKELNINKVQAVNIATNMSKSIDQAKGYNKYVFLVFSKTHPFIYKQRVNNIPLLEIEIDISILDQDGVIIADRVATDNNVIFYNPKDALDKLKIKYCNNQRIADTSIWNEVKKYEILIPESIDLNKYLINARRV